MSLKLASDFYMAELVRENKPMILFLYQMVIYHLAQGGSEEKKVREMFHFCSQQDDLTAKLEANFSASFYTISSRS